MLRYLWDLWGSFYPSSLFIGNTGFKKMWSLSNTFKCHIKMWVISYIYFTTVNSSISIISVTSLWWFIYLPPPPPSSGSMLLHWLNIKHTALVSSSSHPSRSHLLLLLCLCLCTLRARARERERAGHWPICSKTWQKWRNAAWGGGWTPSLPSNY